MTFSMIAPRHFWEFTFLLRRRGANNHFLNGQGVDAFDFRMTQKEHSDR